MFLIELDEETLSRKRRCPARFEEGAAESCFPATPEDGWRRWYFESLDMTISTIRDRFDQESTSQYHLLTELLTSAIKGSEVTLSSDIKSLYSSDLNMNLLEVQLHLLSSLSLPVPSSVADFAKWLSGSENRGCLTEVEKLVKLILTLPATNATSERSFSALRRLKTYLRSSMDQKRLNAIMLLNSYKEQTDTLDPEAVITEFVACHSGRKQRIAVK